MRFLAIGVSAVLMCSAGDVRAEGLESGPHQRVVNDVRLWYRVAGRSEGLPVVFLHGGPGQGSQTFARFAGPELEADLRMVYLDQRGSGRSERPWDWAYSLDVMVEDIEALRQQWGTERIVVLGHSFGTLLALEYAARYPQHTAGVVLAAAVPDLPAAFDAQCERLSQQLPDIYPTAVAQKDIIPGARCNPLVAGRTYIDAAMYPDPAIMALVDATDNADGLRDTGEVGTALFGNGLFGYRFTAHDRLTMPVMVIAGERDYQAAIGPQRALVDGLTMAQFKAYEDHGHFMFVEDASRFARDLKTFVSGL